MSTTIGEWLDGHEGQLDVDTRIVDELIAVCRAVAKNLGIETGQTECNLRSDWQKK
jgi:hypothetical protein